MGKIAFIFPGQGAQYVGMGRELYDNFAEIRELFDRSNDILNEDISGLCFNGPEEELKKTENTQPAILMVSIAAMKVMRAHGIEPQITAGLSLGEYGALVTAGSISFEDALPLVRKRGRFMQDAVPIGEGTMAAILGLETPQVEECCRQAQTAGIVQAANYNCPGQIVISGQVAAVEKACEIAKEMGAKRALLLPVSAPFHSSLLEPAGVNLGKELDKITISDPAVPLVSNVEALPVRDGVHIRELLIKQVSHPVRWEDSVRYMMGQGIDTFVELGPGKALNGFLKKISRDLNGYNVEDMNSLENTLKGLGGSL